VENEDVRKEREEIRDHPENCSGLVIRNATFFSSVNRGGCPEAERHLRGVSLRLEEGEWTAVLTERRSPSKTTLFNIASGLLMPLFGAVRYDSISTFT
jgi:ABC-type multidrug transport system ATPase subunit